MRTAVTVVQITLLLAGAVCFAQETTGEIAGVVTSSDSAPLPGVALVLENPDTGFRRSTVASSDGGYRLVALQPASYRLTASMDGFRTVVRQVRVELGRSVSYDVMMEIGEFTNTIEVTGEMPQVDVSSTVSGFTANADELSARLPISRDVVRVAMLAPGTVTADPRFSGVNDKTSGGAIYTPGQQVPIIAGSSAAENGYLVNGLNTTSFSKMIGSSFVPMDFVEEVQIKTGGYQAEFGRSTGGVVNLVTKSGTNTLRGGVSLYWNPRDLQELEADTYQRDFEGALSLYRANSSEDRASLEANASLGGPLVRDRLFLFGFVSYRDWSRLDAFTPTLARRAEAGDPHWGAKLDWNISSSHRLEGTVISDHTDIDEGVFAVDPETGAVGGLLSTGYTTRGGENWILKYTGVLSDNVLLSAQAGFNPFERMTPEDPCPVASDYRSGSYRRLGCWVNRFPGFSSDDRTAYRLDVDFFVRSHRLRAGIDAESNISDGSVRYSGGASYSYYLNGAEGIPPEDYRFPELPWDQTLVLVRHRNSSGRFEVISNAAYLQDSWAVSPDLTLNLGIRWERFESKNSLGETFMNVSDQYAPRIGAVWDLGGDGRSKLYGHLGLYHLPMSTEVAIYGAGGLFYARGWYPLVGEINPDGSPEALGDQLEYIVFADGEIPDTREYLDSDFEPMSQAELIIGYERQVGERWALGVRGVARQFNEIIEDVSIDEALWRVYGIECHGPDAIAAGEHCLGAFRFTNPGTDFTGWYDLDGDGVLDPISLTADQLGYPDAERKYFALELTAQRRFADNWMLWGSYTWSHSYGNYEGLLNSDIGQDNPYQTQSFDVPAFLEHGNGNLPNDRRHNLKLYGAYDFGFGLQLSGNAWYRSGRPISAFGWHPTDPWARAYGPFAFYNNGVACPRGCGGRTDSAWAIDLGVRYDWTWFGAGWHARVDAMNLTNNDALEVVVEESDWWDHRANPSFLLPRYYQSPRAVRFGFGVSF
jgi:outer membrane receptor protein involved in Fe transport